MRVIRAAAAEIRLRNESANSSTIRRVRSVEFLAIRSQINWFASPVDRNAFGHRKREKPDARVTLFIGLGASHRPGQPLLAMEAMPRRQDDVGIWTSCDGRLEPFLDCLAAAGGPQDLFEPSAARLRA